MTQKEKEFYELGVKDKLVSLESLKYVHETLKKEIKAVSEQKLDKNQGDVNAEKNIETDEHGNIIPKNKDEIPTALPNPHKLTFTGTVKAEYDGSGAVTVEIPDSSEEINAKLDKNQGAENAGKILEIGIDGMVVPSDKPSGGGEKWRVIKEFTIPQDLNLEPSDVKYLVSDDGRITQFGVALDFENKPLELKKVFFSIKKEVQFYDFEVLANVLIRYNTFAGNYNLLQFYRHCSQTTKSIFGEIEKIGKYIKATASTFRATTDYSWASDTDKNVYVYNGIPENENITEICVSIPGSTDVKPDFRGATVTILGVDA